MPGRISIEQSGAPRRHRRSMLKLGWLYLAARTRESLSGDDAASEAELREMCVRASHARITIDDDVLALDSNIQRSSSTKQQLRECRDSCRSVPIARRVLDCSDASVESLRALLSQAPVAGESRRLAD